MILFLWEKLTRWFCLGILELELTLLIWSWGRAECQCPVLTVDWERVRRRVSNSCDYSWCRRYRGQRLVSRPKRKLRASGQPRALPPRYDSSHALRTTDSRPKRAKPSAITLSLSLSLFLSQTFSHIFYTPTTSTINKYFYKHTVKNYWKFNTQFWDVFLKIPEFLL